MAKSPLIGVIGSAIGREPFNLKSWSGSSYYFFTEMRRQELLRRAFGVELSQISRYAHIAANFHPNKQKWLNRFWLDISYRDALTHKLRDLLEKEDKPYDMIQIGGYFDGPSVTTASSFAYYDGNLVSRVRSGYALGASDRSIRDAVAYEKELLNRMTAVFTFSAYLRDSFISDYDVAPSKVFNIGGGINMPSVPVENMFKSYDTQEILFIGVDFIRKGGPNLLKAFQGVKKKFPKAKLHIVGPRKLSIDPHLANGVLHHGFIAKSDSKLSALFERASLFVMPSQFEPFGIAPLEAMVHQIPAIITNQWAFKEMIIRNECGDLVERENPKELEALMITHLSDPDHLREMGKAGRERVLKNYTWEGVVGRLSGHLERMNH